MSRISFFAITNTKVNVEVVAGWDPPLQYYFMDIFDISNDDELLWTSLESDDCFNQKTNEINKFVLETYGIVAPDGFWDKVEMNEGNVWAKF